MVHVVALIALFLLCVPFPLMWRLLRRLVTTMDLMVIPEVYKKLHSEEYLTKMEAVRSHYMKVAKMILMLGLSVVVLLFLWVCVVVNVYFADLTVGVIALALSWMVVTSWTLEEYPLWLYNFEIQLYRTRDTINLHNVKEKLEQFQARRLILAKDADTEADFQEFIELGMSINYLEQLRADISERLRNIPQSK